MKAEHLVKLFAVTVTLVICSGLPVQAHETPEQEVEGLPDKGPITPASWEHYNANPDFKPMELPNGIIANATSLARLAPIARIDGDVRAISVTDDTWILGGHAYGSVVIETDEGLVVIVTGASAQDGLEFRKVIREQISRKPVIAVIHDHIHSAHGTRTLLDGDDAPIIAHPDHNRIGETSGGAASPNIPELGPHLDARGEMQFGAHLPSEGPDANPAGTLDLFEESAWLPATRTVEHGETLTVGGIQMQFFHAITDSEDTVTVWIPEKKMVVDNVLWPFLNMYTLRGDRFRDPRNWIAALRQIRELEPDVILNVGGGGAPLLGKEKILDAVSAKMDLMTFIYDQSLRLTSQGINASEIRHHIRIPASILENPYANESYGQFDTFPQAQPTFNHGWYAGHAEDMHTLPRSVEAEYRINLAGGADKVMAAYKEAMDKAEYLWAKELAAQLYYVQPGNDEYRQALADAFRRLGQMSPGFIARNLYMHAALSLEGNEVISLTSVQSAAWVTENPARAVDQLRIRINPARADGVEGVLAFEIDGQSSALHVRNSVAEFIADPGNHYRKPDGRIAVSGEDFAAYFRGEVDVDGLLSQGSAVGRAKELLGLFDNFQRVPMYPRSKRALE